MSHTCIVHLLVDERLLWLGLPCPLVLWFRSSRVGASLSDSVTVSPQPCHPLGGFESHQLLHFVHDSKQDQDSPPQALGAAERLGLAQRGPVRRQDEPPAPIQGAYHRQHMSGGLVNGGITGLDTFMSTTPSRLLAIFSTLLHHHQELSSDETLALTGFRSRGVEF